jgi:hypothetical protein
MLDALRPLHMVLLGAVLVALVGIVLLGNWPVSWYLQSPVGLALGALLLTAGGQLWPGCGRGGGWLARLAAHLPLLHLLAVVFAGWCVYARTLGCVVDVIL